MIGILEVCVRNHSVLVDSWIFSLKDLGYKVIVYSTNEIAENLKESPYELKIKKKEQSMFSFFREINSDIRKHDIKKLIITSVQLHYMHFFWFRPKVEVWLTIHNGVTWFGKEPSLLKGYVKNLVKTRILKNSSALIVGSNNIKNYVLSTKKYSKPIHVFPFIIYKNTSRKSHPKRSDKLVIVIPGGISGKRKKYKNLFDAIHLYRNMIRLIFLGSVINGENGEEILEEIRKLKSSKYDILYYTNFISPNEYNLRLQEGDLIFSDINVEFNRFEYVEIYGKTKDSGVTYNMIAHAMPGILNRDFRNHIELNSSTIYFKNRKELVDIFKDLIFNPKMLLNLKKNAKENSEKFCIDQLDILKYI